MADTADMVDIAVSNESFDKINYLKRRMEKHRVQSFTGYGHGYQPHARYYGGGSLHYW